MSSPNEILKKVKRQPLPPTARRTAPYKESLQHREEQPSNEQQLTSGLSLSSSSLSNDQPFLAEILDGIREEESKKRKKKTKPSGVPTDTDLVSSMATRLATVERELLATKREIIEKDAYIKKLEMQLSSAASKPKAASGSSSFSSPSSSHRNLKLQCEALQQQVDDMEEFLNDYGLVWVGKCPQAISSPQNSSTPSQPLLWSPDSSLPLPSSPPFKIDFNLVISNVSSLNTIAGKDCHIVTHTPNGAELKIPDPIPLSLYANGLMLFNGPFRPYTDPMTQEFIQDLTDGYFPSELKEAYPEGVPFELIDKHCEECRQTPHHYRLFPGTGQKLSQEISTASTPNNTETAHSHNSSSSSKRTVSVENFLKRIPKNVIRGGRVIDIHAGLTETLQGSSSRVKLLNTPVMEEIKQRLEYDEEVRPHTPGRLATLRIKSETGDTTYVLKMHSMDTIGDIHRQLNKLKSNGDKKDLVLKGAFPPRSFNDMTATLSDCGLVPSANLFLANKSNNLRR